MNVVPFDGISMYVVGAAKLKEVRCIYCVFWYVCCSLCAYVHRDKKKMSLHTAASRTTSVHVRRASQHNENIDDVEGGHSSGVKTARVRGATGFQDAVAYGWCSYMWRLGG